MDALLDLRMVDTENLTPELKNEIVRLCIAAHHENSFLNLFVFIPSGGRHFLGFLDDRLVCHAVVTTRWAQPEGMRVLRTAYVDAVSTAPDVQGRGYGSQLMRCLAAGITDYEIACLETDRPEFYRRLGWEVWRGSLAGRDETEMIPTPDQTGVMALRLPLTPDLNLDHGLSIERQGGRIW
jgi:GNAT superfamily N-acetyltransferase